MSFKSIMINFINRNALKNADRITRYASSVYPHISESKSTIVINNALTKKELNTKERYRLLNLKNRYKLKMDKLRYRGGYGFEQFQIIIDCLKNSKLGNCYESSILAEIIGKINGLKNIFSAQVFYTKNTDNINMRFDHGVAVITDKTFEKDIKYTFKNKDAIIIYPWLGITDFAGEYINKIRTVFSNMFPKQLEDYSKCLENIAKDSKNIKEFNKKRKSECYKPQFFFQLHEHENLPIEMTEKLSEEFPELILK